MQIPEWLKEGAQVTGLISPTESAWITGIVEVGPDAVQVHYKDAAGGLGEQCIYQEDLARLKPAEKHLAWSFTADASDFRLVLEAKRIRLGSYFDPMMAMHSSKIEPLPHQISAVYQAMLPRQPLRFVLADDPGAGKTIMAGLLIKELIMRSDAQRVLIVAPGSLTEQWQDELLDKFSLEFDIFTNDWQESSPSGNLFHERNRLIARMDQLARREDLREKLKRTQWDLIIVDEAHKMSAHAVSAENVKKTQRYRLGELLGQITRNYLLMTATPHNGNEGDFNLWLALIDRDRFRFDGYTPGKSLDVSDIMRRFIKEKLVKFDGTRLFPERIAKTVQYALSPDEYDLYRRVTDYVVKEMDRAKKLAGTQGVQIGFALTILQRRLASSPAAILESLVRRIERLEKKLEEWDDEYARLGGDAAESEEQRTQSTEQIMKDIPDEDDYPDAEWENLQNEALSNSAARTRAELQKEIETLRDLKQQAYKIRHSETDCKWQRLDELLREEKEIVSGEQRHKLIIFTEHKDTLDYLVDRISDKLGGREHVRAISGSTKRETRRQFQEEFSNDPEVSVLVATDAAGEGVNLQCAHLLINYDLPWNPNRLEQRFGRIHRIGQTQTCVMWNMVASGTREGQVFEALFNKLKTESEALGGQVFDILGEAFKDKPLKDFLLEAITDEKSGRAQKYMTEKVEAVLDHEKLRSIMRQHMLVEQAMTKDALFAVKAEMDKAEARKLQPYFIQAFFLDAFRSPLIGGVVYPQESGRFKICRVPDSLSLFNSQEQQQTRTPLLPRYERICFDKKYTQQTDRAPRAEFVHPGHPLMRRLTEKVHAELKSLLKTGAALIAPTDDTTEPYLVVMVQHSVREARTNKDVSRCMHFVKIPKSNVSLCSNAGWAPHLDLAPPAPEDADIVADVLRQSWLSESDWEDCALRYATSELAKKHYKEVRERRLNQVNKIREATRERLMHARMEWNAKVRTYEKEASPDKPQLYPLIAQARRKGEEVEERLRQRETELDDMCNIVSATPVVRSCMLVIPQGYINMKRQTGDFCADVEARRRIEHLAMQAVIEAEKALGHEVMDVSAENCGWDITATIPVPLGNPQPDARHIEVKGRSKDAKTITISSNEIRAALNQGDKFILAIVLVDGDEVQAPRYVLHPFDAELQAGQVSGNFAVADLLDRSVSPQDSLPSREKSVP